MAHNSNVQIKKIERCIDRMRSKNIAGGVELLHRDHLTLKMVKIDTWSSSEFGAQTAEAIYWRAKEDADSQKKGVYVFEVRAYRPEETMHYERVSFSVDSDGPSSELSSDEDDAVDLDRADKHGLVSQAQRHTEFIFRTHGLMVGSFMENQQRLMGSMLERMTALEESNKLLRDENVELRVNAEKKKPRVKNEDGDGMEDMLLQMIMPHLPRIIERFLPTDEPPKGALTVVPKK